MYIALLMLLPLAIGSGFFLLSKRITWKELLLMEVIALIVFSVGYGISRWSSTSDVELVSGVVTSKESQHVSCSHSYPCRCRMSGTGKNAHMVCDTCYLHAYDVNWYVFTNAMGNYTTIERIDSQGLREPPRWTMVKIGEPVTFPHSFTNYVKANPESVLLHRNTKKFDNLILPEYPNQIYDYYKANRFVNVGLLDPNTGWFNHKLMEINGEVGPKKQANVVMVEVNTNDPTYEFVVQEKWINGKKNDVIVLFGVSQYPIVDWVRIISWTKSENMKVELRDALQKIGRMDSPELLSTIQDYVTSEFTRRDFDEFKYLMASYQPGETATIILMIIAMICFGGITWYAWHEDIFGDVPIDYYGNKYYSYNDGNWKFDIKKWRKNRL